MAVRVCSRVILAIATAVCLNFIASEQTCRPGMNHMLYPAINKAYGNNVFRQTLNSTVTTCGRDCFIEPLCMSYNFHTRTRLCQLNNSSREHKPNELVTSVGYLYYDNDINTPLYSSPDSSCLMLSTTHRTSGIYKIYPQAKARSTKVFCDMETDGGGWIVFQRRQDGSVDFFREWADYKSGFGNLSGEFWLGNEILSILTETGQWQLRVDMADWEGNTTWAQYDHFRISGGNYTLQVGTFCQQSTAGDSLSDHNGHKFSTKDVDNDLFPHSSCALNLQGAWWFYKCLVSDLNGEYKQSGSSYPGSGIQWYSWRGNQYSLKHCSMKFKEVL